jgi:Tol biopolymer transport system component
LAFSAAFSGQSEIWKAKLQADGSLTDFTQLTRGATGVTSTAPSWSAEGKALIFQRDINPGDAKDDRLFVVQADGSGLRALGVSGAAPAWSGHNSSPTDPGDSLKVFLPLVKR